MKLQYIVKTALTATYRDPVPYNTQLSMLLFPNYVKLLIIMKLTSILAMHYQLSKNIV